MDGAEFTIFFEDPFWVGVYDSVRDGERRVNRFVFGAEPTNAELSRFMRERFAAVVDSALPADAAAPVPRPPKKRNARRGQRASARDQERPPSASLLAFHYAFEALKAEGRSASARERALSSEEAYRLRAEKKKAARRGK